MDDQLWSWILTIVGVSGFYLAKNKVWWCWYINIACQGLWFAYALVTKQYGFIAAAAIYTVVFTMNAIAWTKEHRAQEDRKKRILNDLREPYHGVIILPDETDKPIHISGSSWATWEKDGVSYEESSVTKSYPIRPSCRRFHPGQICVPGQNHPSLGAPDGHVS